MQLILDTDTTVDINDKMSSLEESSQILLNEDIESLKTAISNGNKENIQCKENIIISKEDECNGIDKNDVDDKVESSFVVDDKAVQNLDILPKDDTQNNCADVVTNGTTSTEEINANNTVNLEGEENILDADTQTKDSKETLDGEIQTENITEPNDMNNEPKIGDNVQDKLAHKGDLLKLDNYGETENYNDENVSEKSGDKLMEVEDELEDELENTDINKTIINNENSSEIPTVASLLPAPRSQDDVANETKTNIEDSIETIMELDNLEQNVTHDSKSHEETLAETETLNSPQENELSDSAKVDRDDSLDTAMEVDVSKPESSIMEGESFVENVMECSDTIENTLTVNKEDILKNTEDDKNSTVLTEMQKDTSSNEEVTDIKDSAVDKDLVIESTLSIGKDDGTNNKTDEAKDVVLENNFLMKDVEAENTPLTNMETVPDDIPAADENIITSEIKSSSDKGAVENTSGPETDTILHKTEVSDKQDTKAMETVDPVVQEIKSAAPVPEKIGIKLKPFSKLCNTLDILSDDEDEPSNAVPKEIETPKPIEKQCINIEDDDDIMFFDEDCANKDSAIKPAFQKTEQVEEKREDEKCADSTCDLENKVENIETGKATEIEAAETEKDSKSTEIQTNTENVDAKNDENLKDTIPEKELGDKPLLAQNFLKTYKKNLSDMSREDLEEFCVLKIVESIVDRSNLSDIKTKLKEMAQSIEEYKKKAMMLTKQNRDLQVVVKSVQEEQKKFADNPTVIKPLKITRSVGMQVLMTEKPGIRKKSTTTTVTGSNTSNANNRNLRTINQSPKAQKSPAANQTIPVPRLVPANSPAKITMPTVQNTSINTQTKTPSTTPNGVKNSPPVQKVAEKRPISRVSSVTVDLTDDEPPPKLITPRNSPAPPVRLVSPQNLLAARQPFGQTLNSPRKVYIPISGPQGQNVRPGQAIMLKSVSATGPAIRGPRIPPPQITRMPQNTIRMQSRGQSRHPAPLPDAVKQYQPPNWKALPPAPDLKLSKVENGIVISWKIEGYQEDSYEEIASYQLYAYQETSSPPSTALWKKIGDVKALPLPMACTLTHVMAGFKYYFAVRAVDIRSRLGPFSLPGSILLLNKL